MENLQNQKSNEELVAIPEKYMLTIREAEIGRGFLVSSMPLQLKALK